MFLVDVCGFCGVCVFGDFLVVFVDGDCVVLFYGVRYVFGDVCVLGVVLSGLCVICGYSGCDVFGGFCIFVFFWFDGFGDLFGL